MKPALIIGVTGQDGTLLADLLKSRGIDYAGINTQGLVDPEGRVIQSGSLTDPHFIRHVIQSSPPSRVFYLAAHHHSSQDADLSNDADLWKLSLDVQVLGLALLRSL